jgi:hypothetical protein
MFPVNDLPMMGSHVCFIVRVGCVCMHVCVCVTPTCLNRPVFAHSTYHPTHVADVNQPYPSKT